MKEKLICARCKKEIDRKGKWVHIEDYNNDKKEGEIDIHLSCWKDQYKEKINKAFEEKAKSISPFLNKIMKEGII